MTNYHERLRDDGEVKLPSERSFAITFAVVFLLVACAPLIHGGALRLWAVGAGLIFLAVAFTKPVILRPLNKLWLKFGLALHRIVNPLVLGAMFILVVTPMALFIRLTGKRMLQQSFEPELPSYWMKRNPPGPEPDSIRQQF
jgi:hypothetical protein